MTELEEEVRTLRKELWQSRDATIGATATAGSYKARNVELEMLVHQLRTELARMDASLQVAQGSLTGRMNAALGLPRRVARKILRP